MALSAVNPKLFSLCKLYNSRNERGCQRERQQEERLLLQELLVNKQDFLKVFQGSGIEMMEDNKTNFLYLLGFCGRPAPPACLLLLLIFVFIVSLSLLLLSSFVVVVVVFQTLLLRTIE